tara:strand:+ start:480 stop:1385 length:906 start_codon:yes stop_codon:yes gene_type:complete
VIKLGIIGLKNKDNGHPFSFSAIINGYNEKYFKLSNYKNILNYLKKKPKKSFGIKGVKITHAWTQSLSLTKTLCKSCNIDNAVENYKDMLGNVNGVIIARDDLHYSISKHFLKKNIPVFIDKPLTSKIKELNFFKKYLKSALLMSSSGLRFANEVNLLKKNQKKLGRIKSVNALVLNDFFKYGVHMLDILDELNLLKVKKVLRLKSNIDQIIFYCENKAVINLQCLGKINKIFSITLIGQNATMQIDIKDNFSAFKNTLVNFIKMIKTKKQVINYKKTLKVINLLIKTNNLKYGKIQRFKK